jgi:hypothetical protein
MTYLGGAVNRKNVFNCFYFVFSFYTPLHVLALMGHLQVEYTPSLMEAIMPTIENTVSIDGTPKRVIIMDTTGCNPQKLKTQDFSFTALSARGITQPPS